MKPNKPKRSFTQTAFNVQSDVSLIGGRLVRSSMPEGYVGGIPEAPIDGNVYGRKNEEWVKLTKFTIQVCVDGLTKSLDIYTAGTPY